jgi:hypothetical protein
LTIRAIEKGQFCVTEFEPNHNHDLVVKPVESNTGSVNSTAVSKSVKPKKPFLVKKYIPKVGALTAGPTSATATAVSNSATLICGVATRTPIPGASVGTTSALFLFLSQIHWHLKWGWSLMMTKRHTSTMSPMLIVLASV